MSADNPDDMSSWTTFWVKIWRGAAVDLKGEEAVRYMKENTTSLRDVWQSAIDWTPEGSYVGVNEMKYWIPVPWDNRGGRVTLAGDAAHPMLICELQEALLNPLPSHTTNDLPIRPRTRLSALHHRCSKLCRCIGQSAFNRRTDSADFGRI